jgi:TonB family protein
MSAEANNSVSGVWAGLEGHVVNGVFPLHRLLGSSDHSGVFLSESAKRSPADVAIKLVPVISTPVVPKLSRWLTAADLSHPHLLRIFQAGKCQLDGLDYLYAVMEYADQNLAQLLERRALTEDEAREMLAPTLSALTFLHEKKFVHGHLKPSNVLVVGDQLKLAGDTNRLVDEVGESVSTLSVYHPPEGRDGRCCTEGDVWALGVTMCEALTQRQPSGLRGGGDDVVLPADLPPAFREFIARCLSRSPHDRPQVAELEAWVRGKPLAPTPVAIPDSAAMALLESPLPPAVPAPRPKAASLPAQGLAIRTEMHHDTSAEQGAKLRVLPIVVAAFAVFALTWAGLRAMRPERAPPPPAPVAAVTRDSVAAVAPDVVADVPEPAPSQISTTPEPVIRDDPAPVPSLAIHEVIPEVPQRARRTISGTVRVSVRLIVEQDGTVFAAISDDPGPSRYFERLAIDAAKQWTFPPAENQTQRFVQVRFAFSRDGTTARAAALR